MSEAKSEFMGDGSCACDPTFVWLSPMGLMRTVWSLLVGVGGRQKALSGRPPAYTSWDREDIAQEHFISVNFFYFFVPGIEPKGTPH